MSNQPRFRPPKEDQGWKDTVRREQAAILVQRCRLERARGGGGAGCGGGGDALSQHMTEFKNKCSSKSAAPSGTASTWGVDATSATSRYRTRCDTALDAAAAASYFRGPLDGGDGVRCARGTMLETRSRATAQPANVTSNAVYGWSREVGGVRRAGGAEAVAAPVGAKRAGPWFGLRKAPKEG